MRVWFNEMSATVLGIESLDISCWHCLGGGPGGVALLEEVYR